MSSVPMSADPTSSGPPDSRNLSIADALSLKMRDARPEGRPVHQRVATLPKLTGRHTPATVVQTYQFSSIGA